MWKLPGAVEYGLGGRHETFAGDVGRVPSWRSTASNPDIDKAFLAYLDATKSAQND